MNRKSVFRYLSQFQKPPEITLSVLGEIFKIYWDISPKNFEDAMYHPFQAEQCSSGNEEKAA